MALWGREGRLEVEGVKAMSVKGREPNSETGGESLFLGWDVDSKFGKVGENFMNNKQNTKVESEESSIRVSRDV